MAPAQAYGISASSFPTYSSAEFPMVISMDGLTELAERLNLLPTDQPLSGSGIALMEDGCFYDLVELIAALIPDEAT